MFSGLAKQILHNAFSSYTKELVLQWKITNLWFLVKVAVGFAEISPNSTVLTVTMIFDGLSYRVVNPTATLTIVSTLLFDFVSSFFGALEPVVAIMSFCGI